MAQLNFFAITSDIELVLEFVFEQTDCRVFEAYSRPGCELREFTNISQLRESDFLDANHGRYFLRALSRGVGIEPIVKEFTLDKTGEKRQSIDAPAMFQVVQGGPAITESNAIRSSTFSHWNEAGAKQRSVYTDDLLNRTNWKHMRLVSGQTHRHIKNKLAVARLHSQPVLPGIFHALGDTLHLDGYPESVGKDSPELEVL